MAVVNCPYCGVPSTDVPEHAEQRHGISRREQDKHQRASEGFDWREIHDGLLIPGSSDEHPGLYL